MADFASACFKGTALRWHGTLDLEIQRDWPRLQRAILLKFTPTFKGIDGAECEAFIFAMRERIFEEGRDDDHSWGARYVATRFEGAALRWHASLEPGVRNDWEQLQQAMFEQYPSSEDGDMTSAR